ncbi:SDR family NAD(P)-dependent oxidoreductase [Paenibacillus thalictri]|uniref:SDR family oxidoreductase n=1 Tax=Paenibacillus thalictri TaxID=2527873 RepID=A0A4Q9DSX6_9BACL|nr:SDR family oxidoreductase [Paenibacillus thalictri]TBL79075.1 SDR family oxidoreductase [Paenibacillus thalictri]
MGKLDCKIAIVTGGGSGIGRASAELLAKEGAKVAVVDKYLHKAQETAALIGDTDRALAIQADVVNETEVSEMVAQVVREWGQVDLLHNHAGILHPHDASILEIDEKTIDETLGINVKGQMLVAKHTARAMSKSGGGAIVGTASDLSFIALAGVAGYVTSKAAIAGLTRAMAVDLAPHNIRVNAVCPGFIYTGMTAGLAGNAEVMESMRESYLIKRLGQPSDVASAVLYLLLPDAGFVTGSLLVVDGGHIIQ